MNVLNQIYLYHLLKKDYVARRNIAEHFDLTGATSTHHIHVHSAKGYQIDVARTLFRNNFTDYSFEMTNKSAFDYLPETYHNTSYFAKKIYEMYCQKIKDWNIQK